MADSEQSTEGKPSVPAPAAVPKNKGGRPPNKPLVTPEEIARIALTAPTRSLYKKTGISDEDARIIKRVTQMSVEEFQEHQRKGLQELADLAKEQAIATIGTASALQAATVMGICADKLDRQPKVTNNLHVHLKEADRGDLLTVLLGRQKERTVSVAPQSPILTKEVKKPGPIIDLDPSDPAK
jgi:hypothetical protein